MPSRPSSLRRLVGGGPSAWVRRGALAAAVVLVGVGLASSNGLHSDPVELDDGSAWTVQGRDLVHGSAESGKGDWLLPSAVGAKGRTAKGVRIAQDGKHTVVVDPSTGDVFGIDPVNLTDERVDRGDGEDDEVASAEPLVRGGEAYLVSDGAIRWIDPITTDVKKTIPVREGKIVATIDDDGILWAYTPRSGVLRRIRRGEVTGDVRLLDPGAKAQVTLAAGVPVVLDESSRTLHWINRRTGESARSVALPANGLLQGPSSAGDRVWIAVPSRKSVIAVSPDGKATETDLGHADLRRPEVTDGEVYVTAESGTVDVLDAETAERTVADKPLKVAARSDFQSFVKDDLVWFSSPTARSSGTLAADGTARPIDVDREQLAERSAATPDVDEVAIQRIAEPERKASQRDDRESRRPEQPATPAPQATRPLASGGTSPGTPAGGGAGPSGGTGATVPSRPSPGPAVTSPTTESPRRETPDVVDRRPEREPEPEPRPRPEPDPEPEPEPEPEPQPQPQPQPVMVRVPDVRGDVATVACAEIEASGLTCDPGPQPNRRVVALAPMENTEVEEGSAVTVTVQGDIAVPNLAGQNPGAACAALTQRGLGCDPQPYGTLAVGEPAQSVNAQSPAADQLVAPDATVTYEYYEAEGGVVPDIVSGRPFYDDACAAVQAAGLSCVQDARPAPEPVPASVVWDQGTPAGTVLPKGSGVVITFDYTEWLLLVSCKPGGRDVTQWNDQRFFIQGTQPGGWYCQRAGLVATEQIPGTVPFSVATVPSTGEDDPRVGTGVGRVLGYVLANPYQGAIPVYRYVGRSTNWLSIDPNDPVGVALKDSDTADPVGYVDQPFWTFPPP